MLNRFRLAGFATRTLRVTDAFGSSSSGDHGNPIGTSSSNLRPSRRDEGHVLNKYSGKPKRSFSTQSPMLRRVVILLKPSASSETRRDATNSLTNFFAAGFFRGPGQFASDARFSRNKAPFLDDPRPLESFIRPSYTRRTRKSRGSNDKMLLRNFNAAASMRVATDATPSSCQTATEAVFASTPSRRR